MWNLQENAQTVLERLVVERARMESRNDEVLTPAETEKVKRRLETDISMLKDAIVINDEVTMQQVVVKHIMILND